MYAFPEVHAPAVYSADARVVEAVSRIRMMARRTIADHGGRVVEAGRARSWPERVNRMSFAARWRVTFRAPELEFIAAMRDRAVRCEVFAERAGFVGRAVFGGVE